MTDTNQWLEVFVRFIECIYDIGEVVSVWDHSPTQRLQMLKKGQMTNAEGMTPLERLLLSGSLSVSGE